MKALFAKDLRALRPAGPEADALLAMIKLGDVVEVEVKRKRNARHHRKWWALMQIIVDNTDGKWPSAEALSEALKIATGHVEQLVTIDGEIFLRPKSISFGAMDQTSFNAFWDRAVDVIVRHVLPGVDKAELDREVMQMICPMPERRG